MIFQNYKNLPFAYLLSSTEGKIQFVNPEFLFLTKYTLAETTQKSIEDLFLDLPEEMSFRNRKVQLKRKDGSFFVVLLSCQVRWESEKKNWELFVVNIDEPQKEQENKILHRVKNNFQVLSSFLNLQIRNSEVSSIKALKEFQGKFRTLTLFYDQPQDFKNADTIEMKQYLENLGSQLFQIFGLPQKKIEFLLQMKPLLLNIKQALPLALIVTEFLSNSLKYAFPDNQKGQISIQWIFSEKNILVIQDDGVGLPKEIIPKESKSMGFRMVFLLIKQLGGKCEFCSRNGTKFILEF